MSDLTEKSGDGVHVNHYCSVETCKKWGGLGYATAPAAPIVWWCEEHYPYWNREKVDGKR